MRRLLLHFDVCLIGLMLLGLSKVLSDAPFRFLKYMESERAKFSTSIAPLSLWSHPVKNIDLTNLENYALVHKLLEYSLLPVTTKRRTLLFVPRITRPYWDALPKCPQTAPFLAPAIAELAMLDGLPEVDCGRFVFVAFRVYAKNPVQTLENTSPRALCDRAAAKGFRDIIVLYTDSANKWADEHLDCTTIKKSNEAPTSRSPWQFGISNDPLKLDVGSRRG